MGATSVTGVSGAGSVDGLQKGSEHMTLGVNHLVGPRILIAGSVTLTVERIGLTDGAFGLPAAGTITVDFPPINDVITNYVGFATDTDSTPEPVNVIGLTTSSITLSGTPGHIVNWMVVKIGGGVLPWPGMWDGLA